LPGTVGALYNIRSSLDGEEASPAVRRASRRAAGCFGRRIEEAKGPSMAIDAFTAHQTTRLTGCTARQLRYWDHVGLVKPTVQATGGRSGVPRLYSFRDLVALKVVKSLLDGGMSLQRVRRAFEYLRQNADLEGHLSEVKLITDGVSIFKVARRRGEVVDALRQGQMAFFVAIDQIARSVDEEVTAFRRDRDQFIRALRDAVRQVRDEAQA
jgi:DNA-binding transcriptional MerR regulator